MGLEWRGDEVKKHVELATRKGVDACMSRCVHTGKKLVPVRTATLQGSIRIQQPAKQVGRACVGTWGSVQVRYALDVELGTKPHVILPRTKKALYWEGAAHPVPRVHHPGTKARPYLRPAADRHYPELPQLIGSFLE